MIPHHSTSRKDINDSLQGWLLVFVFAQGHAAGGLFHLAAGNLTLLAPIALTLASLIARAILLRRRSRLRRRRPHDTI
jgi:uncharacterized membrane protein YoaK (UPF0700 family)